MKNKRKSIRMGFLYLPCILMLLLLMQMGVFAEDREDIASGQSNDISWRIDADGHLTVSGTGDWEEEFGWGRGCPPWVSYSNQIKTAAINVTGLTKSRNMFYGCGVLTELDVSGLDTSNVTDMEGMFWDCMSLTELDVSGFDTSNVINMGGMFVGCRSLTELDVSGFDTSNVIDTGGMFYNCSNLTELNVSGFNTSNVTCMSQMFYGCGNLTELNVSSFNTSNVTDMGEMFWGCSNLSSLNINGFDTSSVTDMSQMFQACSSLSSLDVSGLDTSNVTRMRSMFSHCHSLTELDVSGFDTSNVTDMRGMFYMYDGRSNLTSLDVSGFDTSNVTDMSLMFEGCSSLTELDVSGFDTSNVVGMSFMFDGCSSLTSLDVSGFDTSNVIDMSRMFRGCSSLTSLDLSGFDTFNVRGMSRMFGGCNSLTELDVSSFNTSNVTDMEYMFSGCIGLTELDLSSLDASNVTSMSSIFYDCSSLTLLCTPKNVRYAGYLPKTFYMADGTSVTTLPTNLQNSVVLASDPAFFTDGLAGGTSNNISWSIDINGQLTVTGTGNWEHPEHYLVPWGPYRSSIKSAVVNLTGTTDASGMFTGCSALVSVDLNSFDMSSVTVADNMFASCSKLTEIQAPASIAGNLNISLPGSYKESGQTTIFSSLSAKNKGLRLAKVLSVNKLTGTDKGMEHKVVVFQGQFLDIVWDDRLFENNAFTYNNNLAVAGLALSAAAEDKISGELAVSSTLTNNMGFTNYDSQNYNTDWNLDRPAFSIAGKEVTVDGRKKTLICLVVRGTTSDADIATDAIDGFGGFAGSALHVASCLKQYIQHFYADAVPEDILFFVTGHSLGGAVASKVGIALSPAYPAENVYVYSFAPPKYSVTDREERKNIFEVTNDYDVVPYLGGLGAVHIGKPRPFDGTNASLYLRYYRLLKGDGASLPSAILGLSHHDVSVYMSYLLSKAKSADDVRHEFFGHYIAVRCPVDVEIYDEAESLLCRVTNNVCDESVQNENVSCVINGDEKYFFVLNDTKIRLRMTGTAKGVMTYSITKLTGAPETVAEDDVKTFQTVALEEGKEFCSEISGEEFVSDVPLYVVDSSTGKKTKEVSVTGEESVISFSDNEKPERPNTLNKDPGEPDTPTNPGENTNLPPKGNEPDESVKIDKISVAAPSKRLAAGKKVQLAVIISPANAADKKISWESSNKKYASVDKNAKLLLKKAGIGKTVTITAKAQDGSGKKASVKIKIMKHAVKKIQIHVPAKNGKVLKAGKSVKLSAKVTTTGKEVNKTLSWSSSNPEYASVDKKGKVTAKKAGKGKVVTITAQAVDGSGKRAKIKLKIK